MILWSIAHRRQIALLILRLRVGGQIPVWFNVHVKVWITVVAVWWEKELVNVVLYKIRTPLPDVHCWVIVVVELGLATVGWCGWYTLV